MIDLMLQLVIIIMNNAHHTFLEVKVMSSNSFLPDKLLKLIKQIIN